MALTLPPLPVGDTHEAILQRMPRLFLEGGLYLRPASRSQSGDAQLLREVELGQAPVSGPATVPASPQPVDSDLYDAFSQTYLVFWKGRPAGCFRLTDPSLTPPARVSFPRHESGIVRFPLEEDFPLGWRAPEAVTSFELGRLHLAEDARQHGAMMAVTAAVCLHALRHRRKIAITTSAPEKSACFETSGWQIVGSPFRQSRSAAVVHPMRLLTHRILEPQRHCYLTLEKLGVVRLSPGLAKAS